MASNEDEHLTMIEDCEKRQSRMTEWETDFIDSISNQLGNGRALTSKQIERLDRIWDRVTEAG